MEPQPYISIVLPTYNGSKFLEASILSCIQQSHQNWELIIVDDASTDSTPEIISKYEKLDHRIKSFRHKQNKRLPGALNTGFSQALGEYLTWTSDDNLYRPNAFSEMADFLDTHPDVDFVYADYTTIDPNGYPIEEIKVGPPELLGLQNVVGGCFLYRRSVYEMLGGYNEDVFLAEDLDFCLRAMISFELQPLHKNLYEYREHPMSLTQSKSYAVYGTWEKVLRKHLPKMYWFNKDKLSLTFTRMFKRALKHKDYLNAGRYIIKAILISPIFFVKRFISLSRIRYFKKVQY